MKLCISFILLFAFIRFAHSQQCRSVMVCDEDQVRTSKGDKGDTGVAGKAGPAGSKGEKGEVGGEGEKGVQGESCALGSLGTELLRSVEGLERGFTASSCSSSWSVNGRNILRNGLEVYCSNGWTVFQKHESAAISFDQEWLAYEEGFGDFDYSFWLGLAKVRNLTSNLSCKLRVDLWNSDDDHTYAEYSSFSIGDAADKYRLHVSGFSGTVTDRLRYHDNSPFSTKDQDNDSHTILHCAQTLPGNSGWWYNNGCYHAILNRPFGDLVWSGVKRSSTMKFRCE